MHALFLGGSRNIGYLTALRLLDKGDTVTLLVRKSTAFQDDQAMQTHIAAGRAQVIVGDASAAADVRQAIEASTPDFIIFSIGGVLHFKPRPTLLPPSVCANTMRVLLDVLRAHPSGRTVKLIVISSFGMYPEAYAALPFLIKILFNLLLHDPRADKLEMERIVGRASGHPAWGAEAPVTQDERDEEPWLNVAVVRAAVLSDGPAQGDEERTAGKEPYRVADLLRGSYSIARSDVAHFLAEDCIPNFSKYEGRAFDVGY